MYQYEEARNLSIALLKEWLVNYKFKDWTVTQTRKKRVSQAMKRKRAAAIAEQLSDTKKWHVHGHGISMEVLERDLNLRIDDFEKDPSRRDVVKAYHDLLTDYMLKRGEKGVVHFTGKYLPFM